jgi:hypothetical protein
VHGIVAAIFHVRINWFRPKKRKRKTIKKIMSEELSKGLKASPRA